MDVFVIGSPKGLSWARSQGKIEGIVYEGFEQLQHSAKTDSGNSGSPIFDKSGRVHGINTWLVIRQVRAADGGYRLDWLNPRSRGVSSRVIATFLAQPHRPTHFATLASSYEAAEKANMILWACQIADRTMRQMHGSIREMGTLTQVKTDPTRKTVSGRPVITSRRTYFTNTQEFVREASNHAILLKFFDAQIGTKGHDARIQYTLDFWNQSQQHLRTAIDTISKAHGTNPPTVSRAYGKARDEFTQANDTFYRTLVQAVRVYNSNVPAYGGNPYYDAATINEMIKFYRERGLRL